MQSNHVRSHTSCWKALAALTACVGLMMTAPVIAEISLTRSSSTISTPIVAHAPDDHLSMSVIFGPPNVGEDAAGPGPVVHTPAAALGFGGSEMDAMCSEFWVVTSPPMTNLALYFSVTHFSAGYPGSKVRTEFILDESSGDIFEGMTWMYPAAPPTAQPMPAGVPSRLPFGLGANWHAPASLLPPTPGPGPESGGDHRNLALIPTPPGPSSSFDDVDGLDCYVPGPTTLYYCSFTAATGLPLPGAIQPADIVATLGGSPNVYALAPTMGLDIVGGAGSDDIDALIVFDRDGAPLQAGGPIDFAIFSLREGSATLTATGMSPSDVFITNFTGGFDIYAYGHELGLDPVDDIDGLSLGQPQPTPGKCADQDGDGDVDLSDFSVFSLCFGGPNVVPPASCPPSACVDFDFDGDVDLADFTVFSLCFSGSGGTIPVSCPLGC